MGFFILQCPDIAFGGGAIDPDRLLPRLLLLLVWRDASGDKHRNAQTPPDSGQVESGHVGASLRS